MTTNLKKKPVKSSGF